MPIHSPLLSSQILILELSHLHILVKLFCVILMHPQLAFKKLAIFYHNLNISLTINHQKPRNKNNKGSYNIYMVFIPWKVFLQFEIKCKKKSFMTRITIDIILFQPSLYQQHTRSKIVVAILYKVVQPNLCRMHDNFQMVLLHQLI